MIPFGVVGGPQFSVKLFGDEEVKVSPTGGELGAVDKEGGRNEGRGMGERRREWIR